jgi:menaquinone-specific isochorismate synthase
MSVGTPLRARTVPVGDPGPLLARLPADGGLAWVRGNEGLIGWGEAARLDPGAGPDRFARAATELADLFGAAEPGARPAAFASFTFDPREAGSVVVVPAGLLGRSGGAAWLTGAGAPGVLPPPSPPVRLLPPGRAVYAGLAIPELAWLEAVDAAIRDLRGPSALRKVVLARDELVRTSEPLDPRLLAARLAQRFPSCWTFLVDGLIGATPELLVRRTGRTVTSLVLAGSAPRGTDPSDDARLGAALRASGKNRGEHRLSVASVREGLAPLCSELDADPEPTLLRLDNVQHLATRVRGTLTEPLSALEVAGVLHPTAAIGGTPTALALDRIRATEGMSRGRYSGPVGWVDASGDGEFGIALRCAELTDTGARLFAGAGIVAGSLPESELEETRLKLRAMQSVIAD